MYLVMFDTILSKHVLVFQAQSLALEGTVYIYIYPHFLETKWSSYKVW